MPTVSFFLSTTSDPMDRHHPRWHEPLPSRPANAPQRISRENGPTTYGDYFEAVNDFCARNDWETILRAASQRLGRAVAKRELTQVSIFLEKHGAFYHPARLRVSVADHPLSFVVNVAASAEGRRTLPREVKALKRLNAERPFGWFPAMIDSTCDPLPMFMGQWFNGFHEFHLTRRADDGEPAIVVWDGAMDPNLLSAEQAADVYRHCAMILSACYDPISGHQIFPWHHAAGDFVICAQEQSVAVRMITVRNYAPIVGLACKAGNERALLDNLIFFFLHLSVRMRLDRLDGVAEIVWAPKRCLAPLIDGFFQGLDLTNRLSGLPEAFPGLFQDYFNHHGVADLIPKAKRIVETVFHRRSEERRLIDRHIDRHMTQICRLMETHTLISAAMGQRK